MTAKEWYLNLKGALPRPFARFMDENFSDWEEESESNPKNFVNLVRCFIDEHIGKSSSDPLSVKVYSVMDGKGEWETFEEFVKKGYK